MDRICRSLSSVYFPQERKEGSWREREGRKAKPALSTISLYFLSTLFLTIKDSAQLDTVKCGLPLPGANYFSFSFSSNMASRGLLTSTYKSNALQRFPWAHTPLGAAHASDQSPLTHQDTSLAKVIPSDVPFSVTFSGKLIQVFSSG